jgi:hypothetical protein
MKRFVVAGLLTLALMAPTAAYAGGHRGAGGDRGNYTIYGRHYETRGYVKDGVIYDRRYHREGYIKDNTVYDRQYRPQGYYRQDQGPDNQKSTSTKERGHE